MKRLTTSGFTLIEALVALLVLSFGLLGVAAMQLKALQSAHMGYQRTLASIIAIDAQERAWEQLSLNGVCPLASVVSGWEDDWVALLDITSDPAITNIGDSADCEYRVSLTWGDDRLSDGENVGVFVYDFKLPSS